MLKFISTDTESQSVLSSVLKEQENLDEFLNKTSAEDIQTYLEALSERSSKKERNSTKFVNKIIEIMLYQISSKNNFTFYDSTKLNLEKLIQVSSINNKNNNLDYLEILIRFYYILGTNNNTARHYLIQKIFGFLNEEFTNKENIKENKFKFEIIENLVFDIIKNEKNIDKNEMLNFFEMFSVFVKNNNLFKNLERYLFKYYFKIFSYFLCK